MFVERNNAKPKKRILNGRWVGLGNDIWLSADVHGTTSGAGMRADFTEGADRRLLMNAGVYGTRSVITNTN